MYASLRASWPRPRSAAAALPAALLLRLGVLALLHLHLPPRRGQPPGRLGLPLLFAVANRLLRCLVQAVDLPLQLGGRVEDLLLLELHLLGQQRALVRLELRALALLPRLLRLDQVVDLGEGLGVLLLERGADRTLLLLDAVLLLLELLPLGLAHALELPGAQLNLDAHLVELLGDARLDLLRLLLDLLPPLDLEGLELPREPPHLHLLLGLQAVVLLLEVLPVVPESLPLQAHLRAEEPVFLFGDLLQGLIQLLADGLALLPPLGRDGVPGQHQPPLSKCLGGRVERGLPLAVGVLGLLLAREPAVPGRLLLLVPQLPLAHLLRVLLHLHLGVRPGEGAAQPLARGRQPLAHHPPLGAAPGHHHGVEHVVVLLVVGGDVPRPRRPAGAHALHQPAQAVLLHLVHAQVAACDVLRLGPEEGLPQVGVGLLGAVLALKLGDEPVQSVGVCGAAGGQGDRQVAVALALGAPADGAVQGLVLVDDARHQLVEGQSLARLGEPQAGDGQVGPRERHTRPVPPLLLELILRLRADVAAVPRAALALAHGHELGVDIPDVLHHGAAVRPRALQAARGEQLHQVLQDPRPVALEKPVPESLAVQCLELQALLLQVGLAPLTHGELGRHVVVHRALDLLGHPQPPPLQPLDLHVGQPQQHLLQQVPEHEDDHEHQGQHRVPEHIVVGPHEDRAAKHDQQHAHGEEGVDEVELRAETHQVQRLHWLLDRFVQDLIS
mmetsp:Transcript_31994/g.55644  ORF Transcript_31994/g.55644 Transcript_31994/m.55644 type:complete len:727 (-) Transcript_31994:661-2841(-)